ncbi:ribokinase [Agilicoccus flavus]|uniref:ribokinase n=1 Tax=Agilicoccus flavus TaxID=2775968 RepID=UPI001CF610A9|nr:ribokinase [Agilicoccus flavus]
MIGVLGSTMIDLVTYTPRMPAAGETLEAPEFELGCGGKGANQAVAAARLGSDVTMVARVGSDAFGDLMLDTLRGEGIDVAHVGRAPGTNGVAPIFVEPDGTNRILIVKGANAALTPADVEAAADALAACDLLVLQLEVPLETVYAAIDLGKRLGVPVLLNPAPGDPDLDIAQACRCAFFTPNESELGLLTGLPVDTPEQVRAAARSLLDRGLDAVLVTLGSAGVLRVDADGEEVVPGHAVEAVDTTGAGDAFIGAFAHAWSGSRDVRAAIEFANAYAADSVTRRGTQKSYASAAQFAASSTRPRTAHDPQE